MKVLFAAGRSPDALCTASGWWRIAGRLVMAMTDHIDNAVGQDAIGVDLCDATSLQGLACPSPLRRKRLEHHVVTSASPVKSPRLQSVPDPQRPLGTDPHSFFFV